MCTRTSAKCWIGHQRVCKSLCTDSRALLIKLHNDIQLERDMFRSRGWTECMSVCGRQETKDILYFRKLPNFKCNLAAASLLHYQSPFSSWLPDMHNAKDIAIFADNKELQQLNQTTHYIHAVINYFQYSLPHTLDTPAWCLYVTSEIGISVFFYASSLSNPARKPITLSINNS